MQRSCDRVLVIGMLVFLVGCGGSSSSGQSNQLSSAQRQNARLTSGGLLVTRQLLGLVIPVTTATFTENDGESAQCDGSGSISYSYNVLDRPNSDPYRQYKNRGIMRLDNCVNNGTFFDGTISFRWRDEADVQTAPEFREFDVSGLIGFDINVDRAYYFQPQDDGSWGYAEQSNNKIVSLTFGYPDQGTVFRYLNEQKFLIGSWKVEKSGSAVYFKSFFVRMDEVPQQTGGDSFFLDEESEDSLRGNVEGNPPYQLGFEFIGDVNILDMPADGNASVITIELSPPNVFVGDSSGDYMELINNPLFLPK